MEKIPCSVAIITLNVEDDLPRALAQAKHFAEIVVCDGNSSDRTREIAEAAGARVIRQYDTDEPVTRCVMDKAAIRQRALDACSLDWRLFLDADDTFSEGGIEEIRNIVTDPNPKHLVYRFLTSLRIEGVGLVEHQASEGYQIKLVHKSVGARFKGHVHERPLIDETRFPIGTAKTRYEFGWPRSRYENFWGLMSKYVVWEVNTSFFPTFWSYLRWGIFWRLRALIGYALKIIKTYALYGSKGTLPLHIELTIVRYHCSLLVNLAKKALCSTPFVDWIVQCVNGHDRFTRLMNRAVLYREVYGRTLELWGGKVPRSYHRYFLFRRWHRIITANPDASYKPHAILKPLHEPFAIWKQGFFNTVLLMDPPASLEEIAHPVAESFRLLAPGGMLYGALRTQSSHESFAEIFTAAGFVCEEIVPLADLGFVVVARKP